MRHFYPILIGIILIVLSTPLAYAEEPQNAENPQRTMKRSSLFAPAPREYVRPFTWGAEIGASIDLSGTENSTIDIDLFAGYRHAGSRCRDTSLFPKRPVVRSYLCLVPIQYPAAKFASVCGGPCRIFHQQTPAQQYTRRLLRFGRFRHQPLYEQTFRHPHHTRLFLYEYRSSSLRVQTDSGTGQPHGYNPYRHQFLTGTNRNDRAPSRHKSITIKP